MLEVSGFQQAAALAKQLNGLLPLMDMFGATSDIDKDSRNEIQQVASLAEEGAPLSVIATVPGSARVVIALELDRRYLADEIVGEASLLLKVTRILKQGETHLVGDPTGGLVARASRNDRRKLTSGFNKPAARKLGLKNPEISYPAILSAAVGIYR